MTNPPSAGKTPPTQPTPPHDSAKSNTLSDHLGRHRVWAREQQAAELPA
ncbi:hypothetical protein [Burkholderia metallica]|nr:hypothetical protein [Burkholderia metallica]